MSYRFCYIDERDTIIDLADGDYADEAEAVAVAELHLDITPHHAIEVWRLGKMIYRGCNAKSAG